MNPEMHIDAARHLISHLARLYANTKCVRAPDFPASRCRLETRFHCLHKEQEYTRTVAINYSAKTWHLWLNDYSRHSYIYKATPMSQYTIAVIVGSLRKDSYNRQLATALSRLAPAELSFAHSDIGDLPLYNQDDDANQAPSVKRLKAEIEKADGVLFVTPEYNRCMPGVLKNALDHGSRPYGQSVWAGKPAGVIGISPGAMGTALAQHSLRSVLAYLDMPTLGQPEIYLQFKEGFFDDDGNAGEASRDFLRNWVNKYADWVKQHSPA